MTDAQAFSLMIVFIIVIAVYAAVVNRKRERKATEDKLKRNYGVPFVNEISHEHLENLKKIIESEDVNINSEVWHDLDMEKVFACLDQSVSAIGEEYFYLTLHKLEKDNDLLKKRGCLAEELKNPDESLDIRKKLCLIKKQRRYTVYQFINTILSAKPGNALFHIFSLWVFIGSIMLLFIAPQIGVPALIAVACINSISYFISKGKIAGYNYSVEVIISWLAAADALKNVKAGGEITKDRILKISKMSDKFAKVRRMSWLFAPQNAVSSIIDIILEYFKFLTHIDIVEFNFLIKHLSGHRAELDALYREMGELETGIIIAGIRAFGLPVCEPEFVDDICIEAEGIVHPLVKNAVANDVSLHGNVLITGSNASGKSTFLKTVNVNCLLSQTIYTVFACSYSASHLDIATSFDISDDIVAGDSFYIAEIKRLKKIIDFSSDSDAAVISIDEILKGTNTTERIAASCEILRYLSKSKVLVLAATHDIELTDLLEGEYENYYFTENPDSPDNIFDYKLYKGKNYTGNAIKLLKMHGFPDEIIEKSYKSIEKQRKQ